MKSPFITSLVILLAAPFGLQAALPMPQSFPAGADDFADAPAMNTRSGVSQMTDILTYSKELGEPGHFTNPSIDTAGRTAWWRWTAPETGFCTIDTAPPLNIFEPVEDTVLAVYTGDSLESLTVVAKNADRSFIGHVASQKLSSVTFFATAGTVYSIAVDATTPSDVVAGKSHVALQVRQVGMRKAVRTATWVIRTGPFSGDVVEMGSLSATLTGTGSLTGKLTTTKKAYSFKGVMGADGFFRTAFEQPVKKGEAPKAPIELQLDLAGAGSFRLVQDARETGDAFPERVVFPAKTVSSNAGYYTLHFGVELSVGGYGCVGMTVAGSGAVRGTGVGPDGTAFTFASALHEKLAENQLSLPIYAPMFAKKGGVVLNGTVYERGAADEVDLEGHYVRPTGAATAVFYPEGINATVGVYGGAYTVPGKVGRVMNFLNSVNGDGVFTVINRAGELSGNIVEPLTWSDTNKVTFDSLSRKPSLKFNAKTGMVTGSITEPPTRKRTIRGVVMNQAGDVFLEGLVTGVKQTLFFQVTPED